MKWKTSSGKQFKLPAITEIAKPMHPVTNPLTAGFQLHQSGQLAQAENAYRQVLACDPANAEALHLLGLVLVQTGRPHDALRLILQAIEIDSAVAVYHSSAAMIYMLLGNAAQAAACYRAALQRNPDDAGDWLNLGEALEQAGKLAKAETAFRRAVALHPDSAAAHARLGAVQERLDQVESAAVELQQAVNLDPELGAVHRRLGSVLEKLGQPNAARISFGRALALQPDDRLRLESALVLPVIYQSLPELESWRRRMENEVAQLAQAGASIDISRQPLPINFWSAYQGFDDRLLQESIAGLASPPPDPDLDSGPAGDKIRVGFISAYFKTHTIGRVMRGLIDQLDRRDFEVVVLSVGQFDDELAAAIRARADLFVTLPATLPEARQAIARQKLDILLYTDIGMEPFTGALAHSRLAPVQAVTWGHPLTTGIPQIDYYISSKLFEPDGAAAHYSERLVQLKSLPTWFYRPVVPQPLKPRRYFGLPEAPVHVYLCPQMLFKFHPDFDPMLAQVLRRDPDGCLVIPNGLYRPWTVQLQQRFTRTMPDVLDRVRFIPPRPYADYLNLLAVADVILDPPHFGGGTTSLEALAMGAPVVTRPGPFLRSRMTWGCYQKMGVFDAVAESAEAYVGRAVQLGINADFRAHVTGKIRAAAPALFEDRQFVRDIEQFFKQAIQSSDPDIQ